MPSGKRDRDEPEMGRDRVSYLFQSVAMDLACEKIHELTLPDIFWLISFPKLVGAGFFSRLFYAEQHRDWL